jgi:hypothetical protein
MVFASGASSFRRLCEVLIKREARAAQAPAMEEERYPKDLWKMMFGHVKLQYCSLNSWRGQSCLLSRESSRLFFLFWEVRSRPQQLMSHRPAASTLCGSTPRKAEMTLGSAGRTARATKTRRLSEQRCVFVGHRPPVPSLLKKKSRGGSGPGNGGGTVSWKSSERPSARAAGGPFRAPVTGVKPWLQSAESARA